jgi:hypothetical protein
MAKIHNLLVTFIPKTRIGAALMSGTLVAVVMSAGVSVAATAGGATTIHGCYRTSGSPHALSVDTGTMTSCPRGDGRLDWSVTGPHGPRGKQGPRGGALAAGSVEDGTGASFLPGAYGWASVTSPMAGEYCLVSSVAASAGSTPLLLTMANGSTGFVTVFGVSGCSGVDHFGVLTENTAGARTAENFYAVIP